MQFSGLLAICPLDLLVAGTLRHAKNSVVVSCHAVVRSSVSGPVYPAPLCTVSIPSMRRAWAVRLGAGNVTGWFAARRADQRSARTSPTYFATAATEAIVPG
ncbi:Uncharacterised protein [Mycobacteroides abscessus subsp. abscessus]|nr:Uncharacterised protein [Mycobacteroides abscessus subsp. abscessus]